MFKKIAAVLALVITLFLGYIASQSAEMFIKRELLVKAKPEAIFPYINNSKKANDWMPWADSDPGLKMNYSGPDEGVGSTSSWDSKGKMGTGNAVVTESIQNKSVKTQLTYTKPMVMSQLAEVALRETPDGTVVSWSVSGKNTFIGRVFCFFMNMDKVVGGEFEKGLAKLKFTVEGAAVH